MSASRPAGTIPAPQPPAFHQIKLEDPAPAWLKPGDIVMLAPKNWAERVLALEALWASVRPGWRVGYSAEFTAAVEALRKLEAGQ